MAYNVGSTFLGLFALWPEGPREITLEKPPIGQDNFLVLKELVGPISVSVSPLPPGLELVSV